MLTDSQIQAMLDARAGRAQGVAPERILQRALSAGATSRAMPWRPVLSAVGGLAVAAAIIGLVVVGGNLGSPPSLVGGLGGSASASPSPSSLATPIATAVVTPSATPTASPIPTPTPSRTPTPECGAAQFAASILDWQGAAGSRIADVRLTNVSAIACNVPTTPGLQLLDAKDAVLIAAAAGGHTTINLSAGASVLTSVDVANYCGPNPQLPLTVAFLLLGSNGRVVAAPMKNDPEESFAVPPCMGGTGGLIEMNGWR